MDQKTRNTIDLIQQRYQETVERVRADRSRSEEYKRSYLAGQYLQTKQRVQDLVERDKQAMTSRRRELEARVFGLSGLDGDAGSLAISRRDAGDRAAQIKDEGSALDLLARANRSGDEPLARAVAERAVEQGWVTCANTFLETRPHLDAALTELWNIATPTLQDDLRTAMETTVLKPHEINSMSDNQLAELVAADDPAPVEALNSPTLTAEFQASLGLE